MYFRDNEMPTVMDVLDPVQIFIPSPSLSNISSSRVLEHLSDQKEQTVTVLTEVMEASANTMKEYDSVIRDISSEEVQPLQLLLIEDILFTEFNFDLEDFKRTVMHHNLLASQMLVGQIRDATQQVMEYFEDRLDE